MIVENIISFIKCHFLIIIFLIISIGMLVLGLFESPNIETIPVPHAVIMHSLCVAGFILGYVFNMYKYEKIYSSNNYERMISKFPMQFFKYSYILIFIGVITTFLTISAVTKLTDYLYYVFHYKDYFREIREIKYRFSDGGLSGLFKVFNYLPLAVFLLSGSLLTFFQCREKKSRRRLLILFYISLITTILKMFLIMDRLSLLAIFSVVLYQSCFGMKQLKFKFLLFIPIFILLNYITAVKMNGLGILDFLHLYCRLGLSNYQLLIENFDQWSFGFNTFLHPLKFIFDFFGYNLNVPSATVYVWDNAQYFFGYLYMDYGLWSLLVLVILGYLTANFQRKVNRNQGVYSLFYFPVLFTIFTFPVVPIIRTPEYWLLLLIPLALSRLFNFKLIK